MKPHSRSAPGNRADRLARQMHQEVAAIVRGELKDPRIGFITITGVALTPDYAYLTVYFSTLADEADGVARSLAGLQAAAGFIRGQLGRRVRTHTTPQLRFVHDASTAHAMALSRLIDDALANRAGNDDGAQTPGQDRLEESPAHGERGESSAREESSDPDGHAEPPSNDHRPPER